MQTLTPTPLRCVTQTPSTSKFQRKTWNWQCIDAGWILTQSPSPLGDANTLPTFLGDSASALESLMTLAIAGTEKSQYMIIWVKSHPASLPTPWWRCQPPVDLPWDLGKHREKFGDRSYHRGWMHKEQTDKQTFFFIYIDERGIAALQHSSTFIEGLLE